MEARYKRRLGSWAGALALNREFGFQGAKEVVDLALSRREPDAQGPKGTLEENLGREPWVGERAERCSQHAPVVRDGIVSKTTSVTWYG